MALRLREQEGKVLKTLAEMNGSATLNDMVERIGLESAAVMRACLSLSENNLLRIEKRRITLIKLTDEGLKYSEIGLPERRMNQILKKLGGRGRLAEVAELAGVDRDLRIAAVGWLKRKGMAELKREGDEMLLEWVEPPEETPDEKLLKILREKGRIIGESLDNTLKDAANILERRGLITKSSKMEYKFTLTEEGVESLSKGIEVQREVSQLTPQLIKEGGWRRVSLRRYNVEAPVALTWPGKRQPYNAFLDELKMKLIALGFKEMVGPLVELMFFNCDALYMPQDHPARDIHDIYFVRNPKYGSLKRYSKYLINVKKAHENGWITGSTGWGYTFSTKESRRLILRSHGTAVSARTLIKNDLEIPGKYFSIARCYRPEVSDKTHLTEFNQVEGIVLGEGLTLRNLLGVLEKFALDIAEADSVKFRPDYFPFTEPSVELLAFKKGYGWMEFGGSGIFRPELTLPLGIKVPVLAWGLGVDRLYMMKAGVNDIRSLFTYDLEWLRGKGVI
ncbi:MAG: phenylalanine--tRNA ligase subunit alpha [Candidatus Bathyarchaeia archaeon]|nr:phenylalanine--tRNA ligase subunit alpha [Candidatus Bathyarchaeota archaeon]